jgi:hypothetical protein
VWEGNGTGNGVTDDELHHSIELGSIYLGSQAGGGVPLLTAVGAGVPARPCLQPRAPHHPGKKKEHTHTT